VFEVRVDHAGGKESSLEHVETKLSGSVNRSFPRVGNFRESVTEAGGGRLIETNHLGNFDTVRGRGVNDCNRLEYDLMIPSYCRGRAKRRTQRHDNGVGGNFENTVRCGCRKR